MDKAGKIVAAAILAASISHATPAFSATMTAAEFVQGLSSDFALGNYASIEAKLEGLDHQGFEGIRVDRQMMSIARLMEILSAVRAGEINPADVAGELRQILANASRVMFIAGGIQVAWTDTNASGQMFPAGSAG